MSRPFFTIVIPTYNRADLLPKAIASVLEQTFKDFEIIVVDNYSSDNTPEVMKGYEQFPNIRYIRNEQNMERAFSRNVGFHNGEGEFLTLLDSDDIMYPSCLQDAFDYVQNNHNCKVFHNLYEMVDQDGRPSKSIEFQTLTDQHRQICQSNFLSCIGVFLNHEIYKKFFFTEDIRMIGSEDYEIWFRVLAYYKIGRINKVNCGIREHLGRSVYSNMYENLEYQRLVLLDLIKNDPVLHSRYKPYLGYINANYFYHEAMYSLHKGERFEGTKQFLDFISKGKGVVFSKRFLGFIKNFFLSYLRTAKN